MQHNASQLENKNDRLSKSISLLTRGRSARLLNSPSGYKTTLKVFSLPTAKEGFINNLPIGTFQFGLTVRC